MDTTSFSIPAIEDFKLKALQWANQFRVCCLLDSNNYSKDSYTEFDWLLAVDALEELQTTTNAFESLKLFHENTNEKIFGFLSYDLKNQLENLDSNNFDGIGFPPTYFFKPRYILSIKGGSVSFNRNYPEAFEMLERISGQKLESRSQKLEVREQKSGKSELATSNSQLPTSNFQLIPRTPKEKYISNVNHIKSQIKEGDFYELNYCCEFFAEATMIEPLAVFKKLNDSASAPFSNFFKLDDKYLLCSSPERFLKKQGTQLISQPIKGTIRKGKDAQENEQLKQQLQNDSKERAENVMIVDLVRNDLAKSSRPGSVKVVELFGVYEFKRVNQLISTITSQIKDNVHFVDAIKNAFPMGSMTGAPKVEVMKNIEQFEDQKRGLYSGALGYISASGDFDFNVVIRSVLYNASRSYISVQAGGAITFDANAEQEYEELLLKAKGMLEALDATILL